ncbi:hypothetical protein RNQ55_24470, partial [Escherichia coli]|nr:hypothetical protein [Escherichia coli]
RFIVDKLHYPQGFSTVLDGDEVRTWSCRSVTIRTRPLGAKGGVIYRTGAACRPVEGGAIYRAFRLVMVTRPSWPA